MAAYGRPSSIDIFPLYRPLIAMILAMAVHGRKNSIEAFYTCFSLLPLIVMTPAVAVHGRKNSIEALYTCFSLLPLIFMSPTVAVHGRTSAIDSSPFS